VPVTVRNHTRPLIQIYLHADHLVISNHVLGVAKNQESVQKGIWTRKRQICWKSIKNDKVYMK